VSEDVNRKFAVGNTTVQLLALYMWPERYNALCDILYKRLRNTLTYLLT